MPVGTYGYQQVTASYQLGQQRTLSGTVAVVRGSFFNGEQTGASYTGRIGVTARLALEPTLSIDRISLPGDRFTTRLAGTRVTLALSPRMYVCDGSALARQPGHRRQGGAAVQAMTRRGR